MASIPVPPTPPPRTPSRSSTPGPDSIGHALYAMGYTLLIGKGSALGGLSVFGTFWPDHLTPTSRFRWDSAVGTKGSLAGERAFWHHMILDVARHPSNPLNLAPGAVAAIAARWGNSAYFDGIDPLYVCRPGDRGCAFDTWFVPKYRELHGRDEEPEPVSPPPPAPSPVNPPSGGPIPIPIPTSPPATPLDVRVAELVALLAEDAMTIPGGAIRTAVLRMVRGKFAALVLRRAVEVYRAVVRKEG